VLLETVGEVVGVGADHGGEGGAELPAQVLVLHWEEFFELDEEEGVLGQPVQLHRVTFTKQEYLLRKSVSVRARQEMATAQLWLCWPGLSASSENRILGSSRRCTKNANTCLWPSSLPSGTSSNSVTMQWSTQTSLKNSSCSRVVKLGLSDWKREKGCVERARSKAAGSAGQLRLRTLRARTQE
jgi:hypothetical protein